MNEHLYPPGIHDDVLASTRERNLMIDHDYKIRTIGKWEDQACILPFLWDMARETDAREDYSLNDDGTYYTLKMADFLYAIPDCKACAYFRKFAYLDIWEGTGGRVYFAGKETYDD